MRDERDGRVSTWFDRIVYGNAVFQTVCFVFLAIVAIVAGFWG